MSSRALALSLAPSAANRAPLVAFGWVLAAFALALACPGLPFVLAPAVFGVLHVAADYRYLVVRPALPGAFTLALGLGSLALVLVRAVESFVPAHFALARLEVAVGWSLTLLGVAFGSRAARSSVRPVALAVAALVLGAAAVAWPLSARLVFAHAHNVVGIALFFMFYRRSRRSVLPVLAVIALAVVALASSASLASPSLFATFGERMLLETKAGLPATVAPETSRALGAIYVFLQLVHYGVWLVFIPLVDRSPNDPSPPLTVAAWRRDLGPTLFVATVVVALGVFGASFLDVHRTRQFYLSIATFHGYLELAAAAFLVSGAHALRPRAAA